jgi:hypothetical protein
MKSSKGQSLRLARYTVHWEKKNIGWGKLREIQKKKKQRERERETERWVIGYRYDGLVMKLAALTTIWFYYQAYDFIVYLWPYKLHTASCIQFEACQSHWLLPNSHPKVETCRSSVLQPSELRFTGTKVHATKSQYCNAAHPAAVLSTSHEPSRAV